MSQIRWKFFRLMNATAAAGGSKSALLPVSSV